MYVAKNRDEVIGTGKTLMEAYTDLLDCDSCYTDPDTIKFYKCQEIKVELKEVTTCRLCLHALTTLIHTQAFCRNVTPLLCFFN